MRWRWSGAISFPTCITRFRPNQKLSTEFRGFPPDAESRAGPCSVGGLDHQRRLLSTVWLAPRRRPRAMIKLRHGLSHETGALFSRHGPGEGIPGGDYHCMLYILFIHIQIGVSGSNRCFWVRHSDPPAVTGSFNVPIPHSARSCDPGERSVRG